MSRARVPHYNALIRRGIDDRDLYRRALSQVREPGLQALRDRKEFQKFLADLRPQK